MKETTLFVVVSARLFADIEDNARKLDPLYDVRQRLGEPLRDPIYGAEVILQKQIPVK